MIQDAEIHVLDKQSDKELITFRYVCTANIRVYFLSRFYISSTHISLRLVYLSTRKYNIRFIPSLWSI